MEFWIITTVVWCHLLNDIDLCRSQKIHKKTLFWLSSSSKVIEFGSNREPVYDFLLEINSNLGPILHCFLLAKNRQFFPPPLI